MLKLLYNSFAYTHLTYCVTAWRSATTSHLKPIYVKQNAILRNMTFKNYDAQVSPIYKRLNFLKGQDIYKLELAKLMHKFHDGLLRSIHNGLFQRSSNLHNYNGIYASNQNYFIPSVHSHIGKKLISYKRVVIWREINAEYKNLPFHHFKKKLCAIIGYRSTKYLISFSKVPVKLQKLNQQNIVLYIELEHLLNQYWWTFVLIFGVLVLCVSFVFCYLASFWEYRLDNLRVFSVSQLQAWECFQVFTNGVCFLLHRTRFLQ